MPGRLLIRPAVAEDLPALHRVIERAYRGETARAGWTHEADMLSDPRTDLATLATLIADGSCLLSAWDGETPLGCVNVADRGDGLAYLGLLCIEPALQSAGLGRHLLYAAEQFASEMFGATRIEMTVIDRRTELIAWYQRRGYARTGETRDFPIPLDPPLFMTVLEKSL